MEGEGKRETDRQTETEREREADRHRQTDRQGRGDAREKVPACTHVSVQENPPKYPR